jgi:hypothetical protein
MDAITNAFSSVANSGTGGGGWLGFLKNVAPVASIGSSTVGNVLANRSRNQVLQAEIDRMNAYNKMTPAQVSAGVGALEQPLSRDLINSVGNVVQGQMASRGLSQAPGIYTQALAQGLAPYQLQQQQLAQQAFFQKLGLPISAQPSPFGPYPQTSNTSQLWQAMFNKFLPSQAPQPNQFNYWAANNAQPTVPFQNQGPQDLTPPDLNALLSMVGSNPSLTPGAGGSDIGAGF